MIAAYALRKQEAMVCMLLQITLLTKSNIERYRHRLILQ